MQQLELLKRIVAELQKRNTDFALCGGISASLYREKPRFTNDVDLCIYFENYNSSKELAVQVIEKIGAQASFGWIPALKDKGLETIALVIGSFDKKNYSSTVDILLPNLPWVENAIQRSKKNIVNYGFSKIPVVTVEDLILSKVYALHIESNRFQDLDDLKSIFSAQSELDLLYLKSALLKFKIKIPKLIREFCPRVLW